MKVIIEGTPEEIKEFITDKKIIAVPAPTVIPSYNPNDLWWDRTPIVYCQVNSTDAKPQ